MLIRFDVRPLASNTFSRFGIRRQSSFPTPLISPLAPSLKVTKLVEWDLISTNKFLTPVMCLKHPLSKYHSSLAEALRDVLAMRLLVSALGSHCFLFLVVCIV